MAAEALADRAVKKGFPKTGAILLGGAIVSSAMSLGARIANTRYGAMQDKKSSKLKKLGKAIAFGSGYSGYEIGKKRKISKGKNIAGAFLLRSGYSTYQQRRDIGQSRKHAAIKTLIGGPIGSVNARVMQANKSRTKKKRSWR
jgi:uncharacterized protein YktA (UPF0223 family)